MRPTPSCLLISSVAFERLKNATKYPLMDGLLRVNFSWFIKPKVINLRLLKETDYLFVLFIPVFRFKSATADNICIGALAFWGEVNLVFSSLIPLIAPPFAGHVHSVAHLSRALCVFELRDLHFSLSCRKTNLDKTPPSQSILFHIKLPTVIAASNMSSLWS